MLVKVWTDAKIMILSIFIEGRINNYKVGMWMRYRISRLNH